jgi:hypothetical protein
MGVASTESSEANKNKLRCRFFSNSLSSLLCTFHVYMYTIKSAAVVESVVGVYVLTISPRPSIVSLVVGLV